MVGRSSGLSLQSSSPTTATTTTTTTTTTSTNVSDHLLLDTGSVLRVLLENRSATAAPSTPSRGRCGRGGEGLEGVCVLYMSMEGAGGSEERAQSEDVVYRFPGEEGVLARLRGSFFTLDHLLTDSADSDIRL